MTPALSTLASPERLEALLKETEDELLSLQPKIEALEKSLEELRELKAAKRRLLTLKMSLSTLLETSAKDEVLDEVLATRPEEIHAMETKVFRFEELSTSKTFHPDEAFKQVDKILKQKNSLNYEMFKAVVFNGGKATTEEIKAFLVESGITQPQTGEGFESAPLTEISSRANYLVRKGVLQPTGRGAFFATLGWMEPDA